MSRHVLAIFSPFSLQNGSTKSCHRLTQDIIWYGESRFRQALIVISKADAEMQRWMQYCLREELFYVLGFVGAATAVGQVVEVPILIRSLADNLAHARRQLLPMAFHSSLLAALDAGIDADSPAALVPTYAFDWWNGDAPPERLERLTFTTIQTALDVHHKQHPTVRQGRQLIPTPQAKFGLRSTADCERCRGNEDLTRDLMTELQSIYQLADGMAAKTTNQLAQDMRKADSLHVLHEQSLLKELGGEPASASGPAPAVEPLLTLLSQQAPGSRGDTPAVSINRKSKSVAAQARSELQQLISLPPSSLKWVWGADLTEDEVLMLTNSKAKQHSGYNESLPLGVMRRKDTVPSALRTGSAQFTGLAPDLMSVPDAQPYPPWHNDPHFTMLPSDGRASLPHEMTRPVPTNADAGLAGRAEPGDTLPPTSGADPLTEANLMAHATGRPTPLPLYVTADDAGDIWSDASSGNESVVGINASTPSRDGVRSYPAMKSAGISAEDAAIAWSDNDSEADPPAASTAPTTAGSTAGPTAGPGATAALTAGGTADSTAGRADHPNVPVHLSVDDAVAVWSDDDSPGDPTPDEPAVAGSGPSAPDVTDHRQQFARRNPRQYTARANVIPTFEDAADVWSDDESEHSPRSSTYDADADAPAGHYRVEITADDAANAFDSDEQDTTADADGNQARQAEMHATADDAASAWSAEDDNDDADDAGAETSGADSGGADFGTQPRLPSSFNEPGASLTLTPSRITLPQGPFGPADFDFVDAEWLAGQPEEDIDPDDEEEESDEGDEEDTDYEEGVDEHGHYYI
ncbi:hypothetical protein BDZ97DRAFT_1923289 [Flammula alnicola]|nr:hypothetical protein BDZ97DRAFT_1923289 [Flammula alnicola]